MKAQPMLRNRHNTFHAISEMMRNPLDHGTLASWAIRVSMEFLS